ncbi:MAG: hypothetical protein ACD_21C00285G0027 [uncultured bacterium]|nr:MAG: hypothetical protein ACD_21C00285G0027 [uncultured bacterium]
MFQQLVGINAVIFYTLTVFSWADMEGVDSDAAVFTVDTMFAVFAIFFSQVLHNFTTNK